MPRFSKFIANGCAFITLSIFFDPGGIAQPSLAVKGVESLKKIFGDSTLVTLSKVILTPEEKRKIFQEAKTQWKSDTLQIYQCSHSSTFAGYGFIDNVKGKVQLITYLAALNPSGAIVDIDILAYREAYGGEIAYDSFRKQFKNKTQQDKLRPGREIKNISGATISVRAITDGVKRILFTFEIIRGRIQ